MKRLAFTAPMICLMLLTGACSPTPGPRSSSPNSKDNANESICGRDPVAAAKRFLGAAVKGDLENYGECMHTQTSIDTVFPRYLVNGAAWLQEPSTVVRVAPANDAGEVVVGFSQPSPTVETTGYLPHYCSEFITTKRAKDGSYYVTDVQGVCT